MGDEAGFVGRGSGCACFSITLDHAGELGKTCIDRGILKSKWEKQYPSIRDGDVCLDDRWPGVILRDRRGDCGGEAGCLGIERGCNGAKVLVRV